ncbi:MAG TPA: DNA cytosine methyltransferase [Gemmataceae bacterium]|nr:DNA cytosine methyltransferase [Gemmataceae bacterium]
MRPIVVVDFFSGCGGTSLGLRSSGMQILAGVDNDPNAARSFRENFPEAVFIERDIREVSEDEIRQLIPEGRQLLLAGCAPCQPFSKQYLTGGKLRADDRRRNLLQDFQRFVVALRPDHVLVENVPGLQKVGQDGPFCEFIETLDRLDYSFEWDTLSALSFGVPQVRRRLVIVASRQGMVSMPQPSHGLGLLSPSVVRDFMADLPPLEAGGKDPHDPDHAAMKLSSLNLMRIAVTPEGGGRTNWPAELILECHRDHPGHSDVYGRLAWDKPAAAITTRCLSYSNGRFGHPSEPRAISLREAACLQTFPRTFRFSGSLLSKGRQVGNAVPPLMAQAIGSVYATL